jgi:hypothetical protein
MFVSHPPPRVYSASACLVSTEARRSCQIPPELDCRTVLSCQNISAVHCQVLPQLQYPVIWWSELYSQRMTYVLNIHDQADDSSPHMHSLPFVSKQLISKCALYFEKQKPKINVCQSFKPFISKCCLPHLHLSRPPATVSFWGLCVLIIVELVKGMQFVDSVYSKTFWEEL